MTDTCAPGPGIPLTGRRSPDGYLPLRDYAAIGDGRTVGLVGIDGRIDWLPVPDLNSEPAFAALLDAGRGGWIGMAPEAPAVVERRYVDGTNVLETTFRTAAGTVRVTDSLNSGVAGRLPWTELARRVEGVDGTVPMRWAVRPGDQWRTSAPWAARRGDDPVLRVGTVQLAVRGEGHQPRTDDRSVTGAFTTAPGSRHLLAVVGVDDQPVPLPGAVHIEDRLDLSVESWQRWSASCSRGREIPPDALRSALALKLLIHSPTGTVAAAATTSLPESRIVAKNYDYRYTWLRDTAYTVAALQRLGVREEVHAATTRLLATVTDDGPEPPPFTTLQGTAPGGRRETDLPGWCGIGPVGIGNDAAHQLQLGVFGDLLSLVDSYLAAGHVLDAVSAETVARMLDRCCDLWRNPDAGIWELPHRRHYTSSKMGAWHALTVGARLADAGHLSGAADRWRAEAAAVAEFIHRECWSDAAGAFTGYAGSDQLDASVLLGHDFDRGERMHRTVDAVRARLGRGPLLYRYAGMDREEGCFVACSFWLVTALVKLDRRDEAEELMAQLLPLANDVGLFAEMIDPNTGEFLGNLPQALSHLAHLDAALTLADHPEL
ncbi:glycoside hydrolase family 15 protein [Nakamurella endophytica]|uniref:Glycosyl hydrolase n=1 Tax=Nakamurella endophytica TaxID=1748367 RepID=A0A917WEY4_9ACTN|nr:glycoside hydrolase family 15 protein [Nakamurella endophytica]GGL97145.1 glycosyl hydrolase [Nakamurella endophytica]